MSLNGSFAEPRKCGDPTCGHPQAWPRLARREEELVFSTGREASVVWECLCKRKRIVPLPR